jgi:hypothetical protein
LEAILEERKTERTNGMKKQKRRKQESKKKYYEIERK